MYKINQTKKKKKWIKKEDIEKKQNKERFHDWKRKEGEYMKVEERSKHLGLKKKEENKGEIFEKEKGRKNPWLKKAKKYINVKKEKKYIWRQIKKKEKSKNILRKERKNPWLNRKQKGKRKERMKKKCKSKYIKKNEWEKIEIKQNINLCEDNDQIKSYPNKNVIFKKKLLFE